MPDRVFVTVAAPELIAAEYRSDWKRVVEILEEDGRLEDAKMVRRSLPYAQQQVRLAWENLKRSVLTAVRRARAD